MVTLIGVKVSGGIALVILDATIMRTMSVAVAGDFAPVCGITLMRSYRPGMKTGQDHRYEAEEGNKQMHAALASAVYAPWIVSVSEMDEIADHYHIERHPSAFRIVRGLHQHQICGRAASII